MTTDPELTRIVRSWLEDGVTSVPDRVLDSVMADLPATPQRRPWLARRVQSMNAFLRLTAVFAVVGVLVFAAVQLLPAGPGSVPGLGPAPSPSASLAPSRSPSLPLAPAAWCEYDDRDDVLDTPPDPYASALASAADSGEFEEWRRVGPEYLAMVRDARSTLQRLEGLAPVAEVIDVEAQGLDDWIAALEASLAPVSGSAEAKSVYDAWYAWQRNRFPLAHAMLANFDTACP